MVKKKIAIYPGTFDPITLGHVNIVQKASEMFDEVVMAIAVDNYKDTYFTLEERTDLCRKAISHIKNARAESFSGLVVDFAKSLDTNVMIRGLRAVSDFEYELQLALMNKKLSSEIETIFLVPSFEYLYLSSSMVRNIASVHGDVETLVPDVVAVALQNKIKGE
ncbi:MAG: pantetheine-phosphate adenylyltransferase [Candidatus Cloacimonetes bacterium 4572_65]|nr:MAG: pantetheine-phosphate adenylyltransferase [Candidatus Cloacimonetes bacterium 4572_65]